MADRTAHSNRLLLFAMSGPNDLQQCGDKLYYLQRHDWRLRPSWPVAARVGCVAWRGRLVRSSGGSFMAIGTKLKGYY